MKRVKMEVREDTYSFGLLALGSRGNNPNRELTEQGFRNHEFVVVVSETELDALEMKLANALQELKKYT